ncbi:MAG: 5-(carboxyamino)imidazole ribonucleotide synthase [Micrococcus sp.]|nr:5-(carboxyamino)imidazole ribonucleotide synthase [Micrococcus sp.]
MTSPRLGVIGGGQLARMMAGPAAELGVTLRVLAESPDASAAQVAPHRVGDFHSLDDLRAFAADVDVITFDHEHVPTEHLEALEATGVAVRPSPRALVHAQDKLRMRAAVERLGLPNPAWDAVSTLEEVLSFGDTHGWPMVVKTARGGYDGKGVLVLDSPDDARDSAERGTLATWLSAGIAPLLAEAKVDFLRELSAQVARRPSGEMVSYPIVDSLQTDGVCDVVQAPAPALASEHAEALTQAAQRLADALDVTGLLAVEVFQTGEGPGDFQINELAMRPHNSGHWSMDGAVTGQFEQHVRAVLDLPLGSTDLHGTGTVMKNVLGGRVDDLHAQFPVALAAHPGAKVHLYGKDVRPGRKVGHVNVVTQGSLDDARATAEAVAALLRDGGTDGKTGSDPDLERTP